MRNIQYLIFLKNLIDYIQDMVNLHNRKGNFINSLESILFL